MERIVDNSILASALEAALGRALVPSELGRFRVYADELARFGDKLNLTAIRSERDVIDKHFADSLLCADSVLPGTLLDVGAGAGFPGIPVAIVRPDVRVTLVEAAKKKVGFLKSLLAALDISNAVALHERLGRDPTHGQFDTAVSRALAELSVWLDLASSHVREGGRVIAMLAQPPPRERIEAEGADAGFKLLSLQQRRLPLSGDPRCLAVFERHRR